MTQHRISLVLGTAPVGVIAAAPVAVTAGAAVTAMADGDGVVLDVLDTISDGPGQALPGRAGHIPGVVKIVVVEKAHLVVHPAHDNLHDCAYNPATTD